MQGADGGIDEAGGAVKDRVEVCRVRFSSASEGKPHPNRCLGSLACGFPGASEGTVPDTPSLAALPMHDIGRRTAPPGNFATASRRAEMRELSQAENEADLEVVVKALADARLLVSSDVDVAHAALIRGWPKLRAWIDEDRGMAAPVDSLSGDWRRFVRSKVGPRSAVETCGADRARSFDAPHLAVLERIGGTLPR
ncbi:MAG: hypothetical protein ACRD0K_10815 [Egibacteraceae bacterium]